MSPVPEGDDGFDAGFRAGCVWMGLEEPDDTDRARMNEDRRQWLAERPAAGDELPAGGRWMEGA